MEEEGQIGETFRAVLSPQEHILPLPDAESHGVALAVPLGPLMDEEHPVAPAHQSLSPAAEVPHAQAPVTVAADVNGMAGFPRVIISGQAQTVVGRDVHPLEGQGQKIVHQPMHLILLRVVLLPRGQVMGLVLLSHRRIEHEAVHAVGNGQQEKQQDEQDDGKDHGGLRKKWYGKYIAF